MCENDFTDKGFKNLTSKFLENDSEVPELLDACGTYINRWDSLDAELKEQADAIKEKRAQLAKRQEWIEGYISDLIGAVPYDTGKFNFTWKPSQAVEMIEGKEIPQGFTRVKIEPNKVLIGEALKGGVALDFARLVDKQNLQVR